MQLEINTETKVLTIHGKVNLRELLNTLKMLGIDKDQWEIQAKPQVEHIYTYPYQQPIWITPQP